MPPDFTTFPKVDLEEFDTDMENFVIKSRWQTNQERRKFEEMKVSEEQNGDTNSVEKETNSKDDIKVDGMDFGNLRATDFKNNKRVILPKLDDDQDEISRNNMKVELRKVVTKYKKEHCDKFGNVSENNLNKTQLKGIKNLKSRLKNSGLACGKTDKNGKLTLDTLDNIRKKMDIHIKNDKIIDAKGVKKLENKVNKHMEFWIPILKPGQKNKQVGRIKSNWVTKTTRFLYSGVHLKTIRS